MSAQVELNITAKVDADVNRMDVPCRVKLNFACPCGRRHELRLHKPLKSEPPPLTCFCGRILGGDGFLAASTMAVDGFRRLVEQS